MPDSIIIYRNPLEYFFWESMFNGGFLVFLYVMMAAGIGLWVFSWLDGLVRRRIKALKWAPDSTMYHIATTAYLHSGKISIAVTMLILALGFYWQIS